MIVFLKTYFILKFYINLASLYIGHYWLINFLEKFYINKTIIYKNQNYDYSKHEIKMKIGELNSIKVKFRGLHHLPLWWRWLAQCVPWWSLCTSGLRFSTLSPFCPGKLCIECPLLCLLPLPWLAPCASVKSSCQTI